MPPKRKASEGVGSHGARNEDNHNEDVDAQGVNVLEKILLSCCNSRLELMRSRFVKC